MLQHVQFANSLLGCGRKRADNIDVRDTEEEIGERSKDAYDTNNLLETHLVEMISPKRIPHAA